jgi:RNA polymerase sporulation-specific sigma factor
MFATRLLFSSKTFHVICLRYGLEGSPPLRQREVARITGISRSYVSRIEKRALEKLREALES